MSNIFKVTHINERGMSRQSQHYASLIHCLNVGLNIMKHRLIELDNIRKRFYLITYKINPYNKDWPPLNIKDTDSLLQVVYQELEDLDDTDEVHRGFIRTCDDILRQYFPTWFTQDEADSIQVLIDELTHLSGLVDVGKDRLKDFVNEELL